jgi:hypothetical protein
MSHFAQIKSSIKSVDALVAALVACGIKREHIEVHKEAAPLLDYHGAKTAYRWADAKDPRFKSGDKAHVIIRAHNLDCPSASANNDFGIFVDGDNSVSFVCEYMRRADVDCLRSEDGQKLKAEAWLTAVKHRMQYEVVRKEYPFQEVEREFIRTDKGQKQRLVIRGT